MTIDADFDGVMSVNTADMDGDGDLDVLGTAYFAEDIAWWENVDLAGPGTGDGSTWTEHTVNGTFDGARSAYAADMDGDGDLDVLGAASVDDDIAWWENTAGDGTAWMWHAVDGAFDGASDVCAADVDGDGDLDVLGTAYYADAITWWENTAGDGTAWTEYSVDPAFDGALSVYAADVDGDGDLDVLGAASDANAIAWWENTAGDGSAWTEHSIDAAFDTAASVHAVDVDGDGDLDVLGAAIIAGDIAWWENVDLAGPGTGDGSVWTEHTVDGMFDGARSAYAADMDGDGDLDVLGTAQYADDVAWWENVDLAGPGTGDGSAWTEHTVDDTFDGANSVYAADVDGDGDLDALGAAGGVDDIAWWENQGGQFALATTDTAPASMKTGTTDDILDIEVTHRGGSGDSDLELATLELLFQGCYGAGCTPANLTSAQANELFDDLRVYKDTGSGVFESGADTLVTTVAPLALTDGVQTVTFSDGDANVRVAHGTPQTYFVVVDRVDSAPGTPTVDRFTITHITESSSTAEDRSHDIGLTLEYVANATSSQVVLNQAPIADAGSDQAVGTDGLVSLDGSGSSDPDGDLPLAYHWTQTGGPAVALSDPAVVSPTFTAPSDPAVLTFTLAVTDSLGLPDPTPDEVVVTVNNQAPIADAGSDQSVNTLALVTLDGSGSSDPDGDLPLAYGWTQTGGPAVTLSNPAAVAPTFTAPSDPAVLTFTLAVTDNLGLPDSTPDQVVVTINNQRPIADAGPDQSVDTGALVTLDGSSSSDPDGDLPLTYHWTQTGGPAVALNNPIIASPAFIAPGAPAVLTFALAVTDSLGLPDLTPDIVVVTVEGHHIYLPLVMQQASSGAEDIAPSGLVWSQRPAWHFQRALPAKVPVIQASPASSRRAQITPDVGLRLLLCLALWRKCQFRSLRKRESHVMTIPGLAK